LINWW